MNSNAKEIFRRYDEYGPVQVFDDGHKRQLAFGSGDQQSCMLKAEPTLLQYDYTRAMALALLFVEAPQSALLLGLGAGSLASFLHNHQPQLTLTAVELRRLVIDVAHRYFELPRSRKLQVVEDDARSFLQATEPEDYDLIFSDIYTGEGLDDLQLQESYLDMCHQCLSQRGWLVLNCWREHQSEQDLLPILRQRFQYIYSCTTQSGNWILFAGNSRAPGQKQRQHQAKVLSEGVGFSLLGILKGLREM